MVTIIQLYKIYNIFIKCDVKLKFVLSSFSIEPFEFTFNINITTPYKNKTSPGKYQKICNQSPGNGPICISSQDYSHLFQISASSYVTILGPPDNSILWKSTFEI